MASELTAHILIDGVAATVDDLAAMALVNYGCFTSMTVQDGAVRGLELHLARLHAGAVELFGQPVEETVLRDLMRGAVAGLTGPVTLRVNLFSDAVSVRDPSFVGVPRVMITVSASPQGSAAPLRLTTSSYRREVPHLKHVATFGLIRERRAARAQGFDDVLFVEDGLVTEGSIWNIGFWQAGTVVWPLGPMLAGTGQALLQAGLDRAGVSTRTRVVQASEFAAFDAAFIVNAMIPARTVASIGSVTFGGPDGIAALEVAWMSNPPQPL